MTLVIQTELQAAEALEKFALSINDILNGAGSVASSAGAGIGNAAKYIGDTAGSVASAAGKDIQHGWGATPLPVRRSVVGAAGGAAIMTLVEALRARKKKQYGSRALIGGAIGAILPHMGDDAGLVTKLAASWMDTATPTLVGAGLGAAGGALVGKRGRRLGTALMGGLAGGALGAATPTIHEAIQAYSGQREKEQTTQSKLNDKGSWFRRRAELPSGVRRNDDTTTNHLAEVVGDGANAVLSSDSGKGALIGGLAGAVAQAGKDRIDSRVMADGRDFLNMHGGDRGKLQAGILASMQQNPEFLTSADITNTIADNPSFADNLPKIKDSTDVDLHKAVEFLREQQLKSMTADSHTASTAMPSSAPKHTWGSLFNPSHRNLEAENHFINPITRALSTGLDAGPRQGKVFDALALMRESAQTTRNAAIQDGGWAGAAKRYSWGRSGKGLAGKGLAIGSLLPLGANIISRLTSSNADK